MFKIKVCLREENVQCHSYLETFYPYMEVHLCILEPGSLIGYLFVSLAHNMRMNGAICTAAMLTATVN